MPETERPGQAEPNMILATTAELTRAAQVVLSLAAMVADMVGTFEEESAAMVEP